jgi:hypothetical protein
MKIRQGNFDFKQKAKPKTVKDYNYEAYCVTMQNAEICDAAGFGCA